MFGIIYHLYPRLAKSPLAKAQFWLAALGAPIFLIGIPFPNAGTTILLAVVGSLMVLAAMIVFLAMFWQSAR